MTLHRRLAITFLVGIVCTGLAIQSTYGTDTSPNFVVIVTDDQSWVGTSVQMDPENDESKSDYYSTVNIERLAKLGMRFTQGYAPAPYCQPTRRSLLIGQTPARHVYQKDQQNWPAEYRKQLSLPRMLKAANADYKTAHFGKWDMRCDNVTPEQMGYDISDGYTGNKTGGGNGSGGPAAKDDPKLIFGITNRTCDFMETQTKAGHPFLFRCHITPFTSTSFIETKRLSKPSSSPRARSTRCQSLQQ